MNKVIAPESIDVILTSKCNLNCPMCWGPFHDTPELISTEQWKKILKYFKTLGTKKIIFTGGEPLIRKDIIELASYAKDLDYSITLSTNTLLLNSKLEILNFIDQIGIPIDGSNQIVNSSIRIGSTFHLDAALNAIDIAKRENSRIQVTVRTVLSKKNIFDLFKINELLEKNIPKFDRWKIYQFAPVNYGLINKETFLISKDEFVNATNQVKSYSRIPTIQTYLQEDRPKRYVFIGSDGDIYGVNQDNKYQSIGNILNYDSDSNKIESKLEEIYNNNTERD